MTLLEVKNIKKIYTTRFGGNKVPALSNVSFSVERGEYVAIMGESGSGKTTLLNIIASLDKPTSGDVLLDGRSLLAITEKEISAFRRDNLGFVFQDFNLLDTFSIQDNIFLPLVLAGQRYDEMAQKLAPIAAKLASPISSRSSRTRSPADRSSAPPSPGRLLPTRSSFWPTSRPARSIPVPQRVLCASSGS
jgi:putative ABC transport system ATP-binding protein